MARTTRRARERATIDPEAWLREQVHPAAAINPDSALSTNNYYANTVALSALAAVGPLGPITIGVSGEQQFLATRTVTDSAFGLRLDPEQRNQDRYYFPSSNGTYSGGITRLGVSVQGSFGGTAD